MNAVDQLALDVATCRAKGCLDPVVGSSITGNGHVCKRHNEEDWGRALSRNRDPYYRELGARLLQTTPSAESSA